MSVSPGFIDLTKAEMAEASESETSTRYVSGRTTPHTEVGAPALERIRIALAVHDAVKDRLGEAENLVKGLVPFDSARDELHVAVIPLAGIEIDEAGAPLLPAVEPAPAPPNRLLGMLMERGVELLAAAAFLLILVKSLKRGGAEPNAKAQVAAGPDALPEEEVDLDLLARKHVEQMLEEDPEKVAALLSRWALGENFYAGTKS